LLVAVYWLTPHKQANNGQSFEHLIFNARLE